jgi:S-adenosylmethionine hydrolase
MALVTLTTDFGIADGYVGAMKGVILSCAPNAQVIDIAHDVPKHDITAGAFTLAQAAPHFPDRTIHVAVVDPGVGGSRQPVIVDDGRQTFVGPDNGLFSLVAPTPRAVYAIEEPQFRREESSATFHGRDIFAVTAGRLAAGARPEQAGPEVKLEGCLTLPRAGEHHAGTQVATVVHIDAFGNLITDLGPEELPEEPSFLVAGRVIDKISETFESAERGELLAYIGSGNTLEIAVREANAASTLEIQRGAIIKVLTGENSP